jgi:VIT1/CCC1 family predicted Fe2+/Mn2+ transporter
LAEEQSRDPDAMLRLLTAEELGGAQAGGDPVQASLVAGISTGVRAIIPALPFFWILGDTAVILAAAISPAAHFALGAAKSFFTLRSWWASGPEMTVAGVIVGGATYAIGLAFG